MEARHTDLEPLILEDGQNFLRSSAQDIIGLVIVLLSDEGQQCLKGIPCFASHWPVQPRCIHVQHTTPLDCLQAQRTLHYEIWEYC